MEGDTHGQATQSPLQDEQAQASGNAQTQEPPVEQEQVDWAAQLAAVLPARHPRPQNPKAERACPAQELPQTKEKN